jgi:hypothetical protein
VHRNCSTNGRQLAQRSPVQLLLIVNWPSKMPSGLTIWILRTSIPLLLPHLVQRLSYIATLGREIRTRQRSGCSPWDATLLSLTQLHAAKEVSLLSNVRSVRTIHATQVTCFVICARTQMKSHSRASTALSGPSRTRTLSDTCQLICATLL